MALPDVVTGSTGHPGHHNVIHNWTQNDELHRYVSLAGNDSNDGRTPLEPKLTIQAAYDSLPSAGGAIMIGGGRFDVGATGLQLTRTKPVGLFGRAWRRANPGTSSFPTGGGTVLFTSAGTPPAQLISFPNPVGLTNARGFYAGDLTFELKTGMDYAILGMAVNDGTVEHCNFHMEDTPNAYAIGLDYDANTGDDASWWRVLNNQVQGGGLFKTMNLQHNNHVIADNVCLEGSVPFVVLKNNHRSTLRSNNFESEDATPLFKFLNSYGCMSIGNVGETNAAGRIFCQVDATNACMFMDLGHSTPTATDKFYDFINGSRDNLVITSVYSFMADLYTSAASTVFADSDTSKRNYRITSGTALADTLWLPNVKRGLGTPEANVYGHIGDLFLRTDGSTSTTLYVKTSGDGSTTGWTAK